MGDYAMKTDQFKKDL